MLKRQFRLSSKYEFNITRKYGKNAEGKWFYMYYLIPRNYKGVSKAGIVISNKYSKSAVKRNKLKRLFREALRANFDRIPEGFWIVIYPKHQAGRKKYEEISTAFAKTIQEVFVST